MATMILGDQGADVIKVEPPAGDLNRRLGKTRNGVTAIFLTSNRSKRSIAVDLKAPAGRELLRELSKTADAFVQNFRPGAVERMGIDEASMRAVKKDLVYVSISGFGEAGPYSKKRVYDPLVQALSGLASIQGDRGAARPRMVRTIIPDKVTALTAAQAITAALLARERSGKGQHVRLSMLDAMIALLWPEGMARHTFLTGTSRDRPIAQDLVFETTDGYITAGTVSDAEWEGMARATAHPEWLNDERFNTSEGRIINAKARLAMVADVLKTSTTADWLDRLDREQVPCAPILTPAQVIEHPQVKANKLVVESDHPLVGPIRQPRPAARFDKTPATVGRHAPALGEHTNDVLAELGKTPAEIETLRDSGVVF